MKDLKVWTVILGPNSKYKWTNYTYTGMAIIIADTSESAEEELERLKQAYQVQEAQPADQKLAILLHSKLCRGNHTDGCSWNYETSWNDFAKATYLAKAKSILAQVTYDMAVKIINLL